MARNADFIPGPIIDSVLYDQPNHICGNVWANPESEETFKVHNYCHFTEITNMRVLRWISRAGFLGLYSLGFKKIDHPLMTALVERWRPETNTFHFPVGELTVTLQDIEVIGGVRVDGQPLIRSEKDDSDAISKMGYVNNLLGPVVQGTFTKDWMIKFDWLKTHFDPNTLPDDAHEDMVIRVARACILRIIGSMYLQDSQGSGVSVFYLPFLADLDTCGGYSWGSAILAYLYRDLGQAALFDANGGKRAAVKGALIVLQCWAWSRFTMVAPNDPIPDEDHACPRHPYGRRLTRCHLKYDKGGLGHSLRVYRDQFDQMSVDQVIWEPYPHVDALPECSKGGRAIWRACVPVICIYIVEYHNADRVMRQFGMRQEVPRDALRPGILREFGRKGKKGYDWLNRNGSYVATWNARLDHVEQGEYHNGGQKMSVNYMAWFQQITRRWIGRTIVKPPSRGIHPTAGRMEVAMRYIERSYRRAVQTGDNLGKEDCLHVLATLGMETPQIDEPEEEQHQQPTTWPSWPEVPPNLPSSSDCYHPQMPGSSSYQLGDMAGSSNWNQWNPTAAYGSPNIDLTEISFSQLMEDNIFGAPNQWGPT